MKPLWVIQENLNDDDKELLPILDKLEIPYKLIKIIPFSDSIPDVEYDGPIIVRGSTTTLRGTEKKSWKPGVWHNSNFKPTEYRDGYKDLYLNKWCHRMPLKLSHLVGSPWAKDIQHMFIRPNSDYKEFTGGMMTRNEVRKIAEGAAKGQYPFDENLEVIIADYLNIVHEARFIVVGKEVVTGTFYRYDKSLRNAHQRRVPGRLRHYAEQAAKMWGPADVYALDLGETKNGEVGVIECNCFNASGLYGDVETIVKEVSKFVENQ